MIKYEGKREVLFQKLNNFPIGPIESQDKKQLQKNVTILIQNQKLQQSFIETDAQANNITHIL